MTKPLASTTRAQVLRALDGDREPVAASVLQRRIGVTHAAVRAALIHLEAAGYISATIDGPRAGKPVRYSLNRDDLMADMRALAGWLLPNTFGDLAETPSPPRHSRPAES